MGYTNSEIAIVFVTFEVYFVTFVFALPGSYFTSTTTKLCAGKSSIN